jgi:hypothetical protein
MSDEIIKKEDLFKVIKDGPAFINEKIKEELEKIIDKAPHSIGGKHHMRWDSDDKYHYIYDNECYLFIIDGKIELRCDRENVWSSNKHYELPAKTYSDIELAYENFQSMTMEDEEE